MLDFSKLDEPRHTTDLRALLEGWLAFGRRQLVRKVRDLDAQQLTAFPVPPLDLSVIGLVRHMTQMEYIYVSWGLGGGERDDPYGDDDFAGGTPDQIETDLAAYEAEIARADAAIAALPDLDAPGLGHHWPLGATLVKITQEYALHNGQGHMIRYAALGEIVK